MAATVNRKHKDSMFRDLFGSPERKGNALQLYNALAKTCYTDPADLELTTLDDVIYLSVKNDISFLVGDEMVLFEHQSTHNPNMPLRGLAYFARLYSAYVERAGANLYGSKLIVLPAPRYYVIYSGGSDRPARETLRLSDAFGGAEASIEVCCEVVNIDGSAGGIAGACPALAGYAFFVGRVREYNRVGGVPLEDAVEAAIDDCIATGHLAEYLREKRAEVRDMFLTEYDAERQRELDKREGYEQGIEQVLSGLVESGAISQEQADAERAKAKNARER